MVVDLNDLCSCLRNVRSLLTPTVMTMFTLNVFSGGVAPGTNRATVVMNFLVNVLHLLAGVLAGAKGSIVAN